MSKRPVTDSQSESPADRKITRRDFIGGTLVGAGAALLTMGAPAALRAGEGNAFRLGRSMPMPLAGLTPEWTGYGGVGDYATSNGNTHEVLNAAHALRNGDYDQIVTQATDSGESYDLVVVGGGFAGFSAAFEYHKERPTARILVIDNHPVFGGEAKQNEFDVDGVHLWGPQGSNGNVWPLKEAAKIGAYHDFYRQLGLPEQLEWQQAENFPSDMAIAEDVYSPMHIAWERAEQGMYYDGHGWVVNPWKDGFAKAPIDEKLKREYMLMELWRQPPHRPDWDRWLDSMTYLDFLTKEMGLSAKVADYLNPQTAAMGCGLGADVVSAYSAYEFIQPGVNQYKRHHGWGDVTDNLWLASFPGGNAGILRHFVKHLVPDGIEGGFALKDVLEGRINFAALDRPHQPVRVRLSSLVVDVRQKGIEGYGANTTVTFHRDGGLHRVRARKVVMAGQQHTNKRIVRDLPIAHREAMDTFFHAPMLVVNVALRHWKFAEQIGATAFRWFEGFGWQTAIRRQMLIDGEAPMPLDPNKPIVLTMYNPILYPGLPGPEQAVAARMELFSMSFRDIEKGVRDQFQKLFGDYGFDAGRDIAAIVANRWGHAYVVSPPGFYFGRGGRPAPSDVIREPVGSVSFGHSELTGAQLWQTAAEEGQRAARQALG